MYAFEYTVLRVSLTHCIDFSKELKNDNTTAKTDTISETAMEDQNSSEPEKSVGDQTTADKADESSDLALELNDPMTEKSDMAIVEEVCAYLIDLPLICWEVNVFTNGV